MKRVIMMYYMQSDFYSIYHRFNHAWSCWVYIGPIVGFAFAYNLPKFFELRAMVDEAETYRLAFLALYNVSAHESGPEKSFSMAKEAVFNLSQGTGLGTL